MPCVSGSLTSTCKELAREEWSKVVNVFALLVGFPIYADRVERSKLPDLLPRYLPRGALGCFCLLVFVWLLSGVVDNIAAAMIGGTVATGLFRGRVHLGYLAALVASANAGGAGSVLGDTTTTMMWIDGVSPIAVLPAYRGGQRAVVFGAFASRQQKNGFASIRSDGSARRSRRSRSARYRGHDHLVATNVAVRASPQVSDAFPFWAPRSGQRCSGVGWSAP